MTSTARFLLLFVCWAAPAAAQQTTITVDTTDALIDRIVHISVTGLPPQQQVVLRSFIRADSANALVAVATYGSDRTGHVELSRDASVAGTYTGIDPMGLFWSGRYTPLEQLRGIDLPRAAVQPPQPLKVLVTASIGDSVVAQATITRRFAASNVTMEMVRAGDVVGQLFVPAKAAAPVVIVLSGSEGGYESSAYTARMLAAHGFAAFAQAYFRADGLPDELASIPVERVRRGIKWLRARKNIDATRVAIVAGSRGTELALLSANLYPDVRAVVLYSTSITTGGGLRRNGEPHDEAAWTYNNRPFPVSRVQPPPEALAQFSRPDPVRLRLLFEPGLRDADAIERAAIPLSNMRAHVLVISGIDDQMGPSDIAGDMLLERLARTGHKGRHIHLKYPEAGHVIGIPFMPTAMRLRPWRFAYGGTLAGYAHADADSWPRVLEFLRTAL